MPHELGHEGMTEGQALINRAVAQRKSADAIEDYQDEQEEWLNKKSSGSGWGRFFGALIAGGVVALTGGTALPIAIAAGVGSRGGSEIGERRADRKYKPKELDTDEILYYDDEAKQIKRDEERFEKDFNTQQWMNAGWDAWTAYTLASSAAKYGAEVETLADGSKVRVPQKPIEGIRKMGGDVKQWGSDFKSGAWRGGGKEVGDITTRGARVGAGGEMYEFAGPPIEGVSPEVVAPKTAGRRLSALELGQDASKNVLASKTDTALKLMRKDILSPFDKKQDNIFRNSYLFGEEHGDLTQSQYEKLLKAYVRGR